LASKPDTSNLRKQITSTIDDYLLNHKGVPVELAAAFKNCCDLPHSELRAFILEKITPGVG
jgi:hypothetical protein